MSYLVDANVLSEPTKKVPAPLVMDWLRAHDRELVVNPIILGELEFGILRLPAGRKRRRLEEWFAAGRASLTVLEFDASTSSSWARLLADLRKRGRAMPIKDSLIAATALEHDLTVVTRNVSDFCAAGVKVINPFDDQD